MDEVTVKFLSFDGCPLAPRALSHLQQAVEELRGQINIAVKQVDLMHPATSESMKRWGSPTILLNGQDISGIRQGDANSCRIYPGPGGVLSSQEIVAALVSET